MSRQIRAPKLEPPKRQDSRGVSTVRVGDPELSLVPLAELPSAALLEFSEIDGAGRNKSDSTPLFESDSEGSSGTDAAAPASPIAKASVPSNVDEPAKAGGLSALDRTPSEPEQPTPAVQATPEVEPAQSERLVSRPGMTRASKLTLLAALWVVTAAIPALIVWRVMRTSNEATAIAQQTRLAYHARAAADPLSDPADKAAAPREDQVAAATGQSPIPDANTAVVANPESAGAPSSTSEASPATATTVTGADPSIPTAIATESADRVSVLVRSKPDHARILRRGKEIGRTPLVIQIGRGERRVFEVAAHGFGAKRVSIDGEKPEILVNMAGEAKAQGTVPLPAPILEKKYERLR